MYGRPAIWFLVLSVVIFSEGKIYLSTESANELETRLLRSDLTSLRSYLNDLVDEIINKIRLHIIDNGFDPATVGNIHKNFSWGIFASVDLTNGSLSNVSTLHRTDEIEFQVHEKEEFISVTAPVGFNQLQYTGNYTIKTWEVGPCGDANSTVAEMKSNITLNIHFSSRVITLDNFSLKETGTVTLCFSQVSSMEWLLNFVSRHTAPDLHHCVVKVTQNAVNHFINSTVTKDISI